MDVEYQEDIEIVGSGVWDSLCEAQIDKNLEEYEVAVAAFLVYSYNGDDAIEVDNLLLPSADTLLRLIITEADVNHYHLVYFPGGLYLQEALRMYLAVYCNKRLCLFNLFLTDKPKELPLNRLPEVQIRNIDPSMRFLQVLSVEAPPNYQATH